MRSPEGDAAFGWLLGQGQARGIALIFLVGGLIMVVVALLALKTGAYRKLSKIFDTQDAPEAMEATSGIEPEDPAHPSER